MFSNTLLIRANNKEEEAAKHFDVLANSLYKISKKSSFISTPPVAEFDTVSR